MKVELHGTPNYQRLAETWAALIAAKEGMELVPGSVKVELKSDGTEIPRKPFLEHIGE